MTEFLKIHDTSYNNGEKNINRRSTYIISDYGLSLNSNNIELNGGKAAINTDSAVYSFSNGAPMISISSGTGSAYIVQSKDNRIKIGGAYGPELIASVDEPCINDISKINFNYKGSGYSIFF